MKRLTLALPLLLALASPAYGQRVDGSVIDFAGVQIPVDQARPPAGHPHIAFRPRCDQMISQVEPNGMVSWGVQMNDGSHWWMQQLDPMPVDRAHVELGAAGLCKFGTDADGAVHVPIIHTDNLPKTNAVATPVAFPSEVMDGVRNTSTSPTAGMPLWLMVLCGAAFGAISIGFYKWSDSRNAPPPPTNSQHPDYDPFEEI